MKKYSFDSRTKRVALIDYRGIILKVYPSQSEAALCEDVDQSGLSKVCRGVGGSVKGKRFKFITNELYNKLIDAFK